jgi:hypothetical protein
VVELEEDLVEVRRGLSSVGSRRSGLAALLPFNVVVMCGVHVWILNYCSFYRSVPWLAIVCGLVAGSEAHLFPIPFGCWHLRGIRVMICVGIL